MKNVDAAFLHHLDLDHVAELGVVGHGAHRALVGLEHLDGDLGVVGQKGAAPAPRAEGADRCQREQRRVDRQDRTVRREIVGGRAGGGRHQHAVADQLVHAHLAVDRDLELGGLIDLPEQRRLVDGERLVLDAVLVMRGHAQGWMTVISAAFSRSLRLSS